MRAKIVDENLIIHTVPLAEVHVGQIELYLDIFFDKEYAEVEKLVEIFPIKLRLKWKMEDKRLKKEVPYDRTYFNIRYKMQEDCKTLSEAIELFLSSIMDNKSEITSFLTEKGASTHLYLYLNEVDRRFSLELDEEVMEILRVLNCGDYFDTSYAEFVDYEIET